MITFSDRSFGVPSVQYFRSSYFLTETEFAQKKQEISLQYFLPSRLFHFVLVSPTQEIDWRFIQYWECRLPLWEISGPYWIFSNLVQANATFSCNYYLVWGQLNTHGKHCEFHKLICTNGFSNSTAIVKSTKVILLISLCGKSYSVWPVVSLNFAGSLIFV